MPLSVLLIPLGFFLIMFIVFAISAFYHVIRFDLLSATSLLMTTLFVIGTLFIFTFSISHMRRINWNQKISFKETINYSLPADTKSNNVLTF